jgi:hypothetical protein
MEEKQLQTAYTYQYLIESKGGPQLMNMDMVASVSEAR